MGKSKRKAENQNPTISLANEKIKFSFEFYDTSTNEYCLSCWNQKQIKRSLECLKDISTKSFNDLRRGSGTYHFGEVVWKETIKKQGFPDIRAQNLPPFHFALVGVNGQRARVYGVFSTGVFYIIWFDLEHLIWPTPLKHT